MLRRALRSLARRTVSSITSSWPVRSVCRLTSSRKLFFSTASNFTPFVVTPAGRLQLLVRSDDAMVSRELFVNHGFDAEVLPRVLQILEACGYTGVRNKTFVDIGANIGSTVVSALGTYAFPRAIAFEPEPTNNMLVNVNALLNGVQDRLQVHKLALTDRRTQLVFELGGGNSGDGRVRVSGAGDRPPTREILNESSRQTITVEGDTFDALVERGVVSVADLGMIWMDAQGHEGHILSGAAKLLESDVPILTEYWPYGLTRAAGIDLFERIVRDHFTHFLDVRKHVDGGPIRPTPVSELPSLRDVYPNFAVTDLLLLKRFSSTS